MLDPLDFANVIGHAVIAVGLVVAIAGLSSLALLAWISPSRDTVRRD